ncbi:hypothetical protein [Chelativorans salis]|uniref:Transposase n=1 Tax=Chelativorans salis TaxID=2978478 RepID=A0ABT2LVW7_9HYPH|nr:hypothetical protein [Chelativorans sp. EGI FJ00035]MCT7378665.1 hypothetical protein [Chelativorans sp. EGI FJ00035]
MSGLSGCIAAKRNFHCLPILRVVLRRRIDAPFEVERAVNGQSIETRLEARQRFKILPLVADLEQWLRSERAGISKHDPGSSIFSIASTGRACRTTLIAYPSDNLPGRPQSSPDGYT